VNNKKAPNLYGMGLLAYFVTPKVEKSNFYKDLERVIEFREFTKYLSKNCDHSLPSKTDKKVK
jgi:hypothetical protein